MSPLRLRKRSRDAAISFEPASFEYLSTGKAEVLIRLEGAWHAGEEQGVPGIELRMERGGEQVVLDPLPDPTNFPVAATPSGVAWRAAFPGSLEDAVDPSARWVLTVGDGESFDLPCPVDRDAVPVPEPVVEPEPEPEPAPKAKRPSKAGALAALPEADRIKAIIAESIQRFAVLEERIETERVAREEAEQRLAAAVARTDEPEQARAEADKLQSLVQVANAARQEAERALAAARKESEELAARRAGTEQELRDALKAAEAALEDAVGERGRAEARLNALEAEAAEARQLASAEAMARSELERQLESGDASADEILKHELEQAREAAVRERGQRASFEQELKRRGNEEFELRNSISALEGELESVRAELARRDKQVTELERRAEDAHARTLAAEKAAAEARVSRSNLERELRELGESGDDDIESVLARSKAELAELRRELENAHVAEERALRQLQDARDTDQDSQVQQIMGEVDRLRASLGHVTERYESEAERRRELEEELQSRVVAEERLRAMLQAKVGTVRAGEDEPDDAEVDIPVADVSGATATARGDFLERLAAAKQRAASIDG